MVQVDGALELGHGLLGPLAELVEGVGHGDEISDGEKLGIDHVKNGKSRADGFRESRRPFERPAGRLGEIHRT
jgi:hypothetical protein